MRISRTWRAWKPTACYILHFGIPYDAGFVSEQLRMERGLMALFKGANEDYDFLPIESITKNNKESSYSMTINRLGNAIQKRRAACGTQSHMFTRSGAVAGRVFIREGEHFNGTSVKMHWTVSSSNPAGALVIPMTLWFRLGWTAVKSSPP